MGRRGESQTSVVCDSANGQILLKKCSFLFLSGQISFKMYSMNIQTYSMNPQQNVVKLELYPPPPKKKLEFPRDSSYIAS